VRPPYPAYCRGAHTRDRRPGNRRGWSGEGHYLRNGRLQDVLHVGRRNDPRLGYASLRRAARLADGPSKSHPEQAHQLHTAVSAIFSMWLALRSQRHPEDLRPRQTPIERTSQETLMPRNGSRGCLQQKLRGDDGGRMGRLLGNSRSWRGTRSNSTRLPPEENSEQHS
jgi:hypothetical protein